MKSFCWARFTKQSHCLSLCLSPHTLNTPFMDVMDGHQCMRPVKIQECSNTARCVCVFVESVSNIMRYMNTLMRLSGLDVWGARKSSSSLFNDTIYL